MGEYLWNIEEGKIRRLMEDIRKKILCIKGLKFKAQTRNKK
jgi:hypothetical protein